MNEDNDTYDHVSSFRHCFHPFLFVYTAQEGHLQWDNDLIQSEDSQHVKSLYVELAILVSMQHKCQYEWRHNRKEVEEEVRAEVATSNLAEDWFIWCRVGFVASVVHPVYPQSREKWFLASLAWHFEEVVEYLDQPNDLDNEKRKAFLLIEIIE